MTWFDAVAKTIDKNTLDLLKNGEIKSGQELLETNTTYGRLLTVLDDVIVVVAEESTFSDMDINVIPRGWVTSIK